MLLLLLSMLLLRFQASLGIGLGGAALALGAHGLSFVPKGPASSSSLLQICCPSLTTPL